MSVASALERWYGDRVQASLGRDCQRWSRLTRAPGVLAAGLVTFPSMAATPGPVSRCADSRVVIEGELSAKWRAAVADLCAQYPKLADLDPTATIRLTSEGQDVVVEARLGEGRTTQRTLHSPGDLLTLVEALTVRIPDEQREQPERAVPSANPAPSLDQRTPPPEVRTRQTKREEGEGIGFEVGAALDGRLSGAPSYLSLGGTAYAGVRPGPWLIGVAARWHPSEIPAGGPKPGFEMESAGAGVVVERRVVDTGLFGLDVGATTFVLVDTQGLETRAPDEVAESTDVRFGVVVRALIGRERWKITPSLDADVAPARLRHNLPLDPELPPLPSWSVAVALGASWSER